MTPATELAVRATFARIYLRRAWGFAVSAVAMIFGTVFLLVLVFTEVSVWRYLGFGKLLPAVARIGFALRHR
jgi:hypothetical protein